MYTKQPRKRESVDIRVDGSGIVAERGEGGGEIRGDRGFADPALAGSDGEDSRLDARLGERVLPAFGLELGDEVRELVLAHRAYFDVGDERGIRVSRHSLVDLVRDGSRQRASRHGELHVHNHVVGRRECIVRGRLDCGDHAQIGDGTLQFWVDDLAQPVVDGDFDGIRLTVRDVRCAVSVVSAVSAAGIARDAGGAAGGAVCAGGVVDAVRRLLGSRGVCHGSS